MIETLTWWQWLMLAFVFAVVPGAVLLAYAACRLAALFGARRRRWEVKRFEHEQLRQRARLRTVADEEQYGPGPDGITRLPVTADANDGPWQSPLVRGPEGNDGTSS